MAVVTVTFSFMFVTPPRHTKQKATASRTITRVGLRISDDKPRVGTAVFSAADARTKSNARGGNTRGASMGSSERSK